MQKLKVGLFFGGKSVEHEVSVITALQLYQNMDLSKYEVIPIYVSKAGYFFTNPKFLDIRNFKDVKALIISSTKIIFGIKENKGGFFTQSIFPKFIGLDIALLSFHGSFGEDGCMQGLLEMYAIPYTGFNVSASAIAMDKSLSKALFHELNLSTASFFTVQRSDWNKNSKTVLAEITKILKFPLFVKPATIGSSIGVNKSADKDSLAFPIEVALTYSEKALIEEAFEDCIEVNCSVLGYEEVKASVCEMPIPSSEVLSFMDKYSEGSKKSEGKSKGMVSLSRKIPAPIPDKLTKEIQETTVKLFKALGGCGVARIDYFVNKEKTKFWINEVNSPPGSMAFYLWEPTGLKYKDLIDQLIEQGLKRSQNQKKTQYTFVSSLLAK